MFKNEKSSLCQYNNKLYQHNELLYVLVNDAGCRNFQFSRFLFISHVEE